MTKLNINQWSEADRPRERLMQNGAQSLSDAELLAILIGSGNAEETAVALMQRVLHDCDDNLNLFGKLSFHDLMQYKGIGEAKAVTLLAACELGKRRQVVRPADRLQIRSSTDIYHHMLPVMQDLDMEEVWTMLLNHQNKLIKTVRISHGGISETLVDVRVIMREALLAGATGVVLCHNHPSGMARPSEKDDHVTHNVKTACEALRLRFLDHVIVVDGDYYSYNDNGKL